MAEYLIQDTTLTNIADAIREKTSTTEQIDTSDMATKIDEIKVLVAQEKTVTSAVDKQVITPDTGYNGLSQVTVEGIEYHEVENSAGGLTIYIGCAPPPIPEKKALNDMSWADISEVSAAGLASSYWSVGDTKAVNLNGTVGTLSLSDTYYVYILGFDHNSDLEGTGIHFGTFKTAATGGIDVALITGYGNYTTDGTKNFNMQHWGYYNYGGWKGCDLRYDILGSTNQAPTGYGANAVSGRTGYDAGATTATSPVANTLMAALPSDLRAVMKPMTKYTDNVGGGNSNVASNVTASIDYLPLLSEYEIHGSNSYANSNESRYQAQYAYYAEGNSKIKYRHSSTGSTVIWWVRSPDYIGNGNFCIVNTDGGAGYGGARYSDGVAAAFKV